MKKHKNKYRIPSARAQWWDYGWNGAYFITICTANRENYFGRILDDKMDLSRTGVIADIFWHTIPNFCPYVELGDFVVMPNHIHGILIINKPIVPPPVPRIVQTLPPNVPPNVPPIVQTLHATSPSPKNQIMSDISPNAETVSTVLRSYKSAVTKHSNRLEFENGRQACFHDHIIRNDAEYQRISDYIVNNPKKWKGDKFYTK